MIADLRSVHMFHEDYRDGRSLTAFVRHAATTAGVELRNDLTAADWARAHELADELLGFVRKAES